MSRSTALFQQGARKMTNFGEADHAASDITLEARHPTQPQLQALSIIDVKHSEQRLVGETPALTGGADEQAVAVIDSHCLTRECIAKNIADHLGGTKLSLYSSVCECNTRRHAQFGLIILYLHASELAPLELIRSLRACHPHSVIFLISDLDYQANPEFIRAAWRLGAKGFVATRTTSLTLVFSAIRFVRAGGFFAPVDALLSRPAAGQAAQPSLPASTELTARESMIMGLLKEGKTNKIIARELELSSNTVKVHVHNILRKMQVTNRTEAASKIPSASLQDSAMALHP
jgi:DNA-binding NarL/FixJ family response regulator